MNKFKIFTIGVNLLKKKTPFLKKRTPLKSAKQFFGNFFLNLDGIKLLGKIVQSLKSCVLWAVIF